MVISRDEEDVKVRIGKVGRVDYRKIETNELAKKMYETGTEVEAPKFDDLDLADKDGENADAKHLKTMCLACAKVVVDNYRITERLIDGRPAPPYN